MNKDKMLDELSVLQERFANGMGWRDGEYEEALDEAIELINKMPSADVVEVVRCKDCEYSAPNKACNLLAGLTFPTPNSYCSYAERKETE